MWLTRLFLPGATVVPLPLVPFNFDVAPAINLAWAAAASLSFFLGMATYPCCCGSVEPCVECTSNTPSVIEVTLSGITNGACSSCNDLNATWSLPQNNPLLPCVRTLNWSSRPCGSGGINNITELTHSLQTVITPTSSVALEHSAFGVAGTWLKDKGSGSDWGDCATAFEGDHPLQSDVATVCDCSAGTCDVQVP